VSFWDLLRPRKGGRPASRWQWQAFKQLLKEEHTHSWGFHQAGVGAAQPPLGGKGKGELTERANKEVRRAVEPRCEAPPSETGGQPVRERPTAQLPTRRGAALLPREQRPAGVFLARGQG
jgi:hypothetical protein